MKNYKKNFIILIVFFLSSCAGKQVFNDGNLLVYSLAKKDSINHPFFPVIMIEEPEKLYNRIGKPSVKTNTNGELSFYVDSKTPVVYWEEREFKTKRGRFKNSIYRIHFEKTPSGLTSGSNVGLIFITTQNIKGEPILFTTVHTCGCYLSFTPTKYLSKDAYPEGWSTKRQYIYGEYLPGLIDTGDYKSESFKMIVSVRSGTHRVVEIQVSDKKIDIDMPVSIMPVKALENINLKNGGTVSFFENSGERKGYVKGSYKFWEKLLMGWWVFDMKVGVDKKLGVDKNDGTQFYTSLKPWARDKSDMRDFKTFLKYWGWKL